MEADLGGAAEGPVRCLPPMSMCCVTPSKPLDISECRSFISKGDVSVSVDNSSGCLQSLSVPAPTQGGSSALS